MKKREIQNQADRIKRGLEEEQQKEEAERNPKLF